MTLFYTRLIRTRHTFATILNDVRRLKIDFRGHFQGAEQRQTQRQEQRASTNKNRQACDLAAIARVGDGLYFLCFVQERWIGSVFQDL